MSAKHTPGPWRVEWRGEKERPGIESDSASLSVVIYGVKSDDDCGIHGRTPDEERANANLIAAAPDLLEALEVLTLAIGLTPIAGNKDALQESFDIARAAIAKAKGEAQ